MASGVPAEVVEAFDINDVANDVYELNFGHRPCQGNIQTLTASDLDKYKAHAWLLSPPCQPYTRQGLQKHSADARAFSFIKILNLMQNMSYPPQMLFVENVVGFEVSDTHDQLLEVLSSLKFNTQEFILSPLQFGIPYSRPRYFCLAKREPMCFQNPSVNNKLLRTPLALSLTFNNTSLSNHDQDEEHLELVCKPIKEFLDIVHPESKRCCCFTKSYYRYVKGTGSLLAASEVANLHSFPSSFYFPDHISLRQQYAMLGNSLSVAVVGLGAVVWYTGGQKSQQSQKRNMYQ
ncbi:hypothetical protein PR202_ga10533 [Eleusine coracana subsp. coracana]|uniref:Uncharacterized protein n=1 Tax=Eleusine coracana subsp. coracana TaxID=191504 RepID=A0AAV5C713_ELECO|nr:hypothetical protein PR202_ga10533 [Eleusine coracana subsp. coracana]